MNKPILTILGVLLIGGGIYALIAYAPKHGAGPADSTTVQMATTSLTTVSINEDTDVYHIGVEYPQFGIPALDVPVKKMVEKALSDFRNYPANPADSAVPKNDFIGSFSSAYIGPDVASVAITISEYTGGAHPNTNIFGVNVDLKTSREIALSDALTLIGKSLADVAAGAEAQVRAEIGDSVFEDGFAAQSENYSVFTIDKDTVHFIFNSYQVAAYASGPQFADFARVK